MGSVKTVVELSREAGLRKHIAFFNDSDVAVALQRFAALVIANHPPQSYMTWQEGFEAGKQMGRNATLDEIADKIGKMPFGDTAASFAVWIREQKT